jgi:hypothetical protein
MFFDESTFRLVNSRGIKVKRPSRLNCYKQCLTIATVKHSASVMVWGRFSCKKGRGGLYFLPKNKTMNGDRHKSVLENHLLPLWSDPRHHLITPRWHAAPLEQVGYEQAKGDGERVYSAGLVGQFPWLKPNRKLLVPHEKKAEGREALHHIPAQADHSYIDDVGDKHAAQLLPVPGPFNAQEE